GVHPRHRRSQVDNIRRHGQVRLKHRRQWIVAVRQTRMQSAARTDQGGDYEETESIQLHSNTARHCQELATASAGSSSRCRGSNIPYTAGSTISVNAVAENRPPMITTASGR